MHSLLSRAKRTAYRALVRLRASPVGGHVRRLKALLFNWRTLANLTRRVHAVVLGDSHSRVFEMWARRAWWFDVTVVEGATASGARNPNSETEALPTYRSRLKRAKEWQPVIVMLGEVDCGYIIWRRAFQNGTSVEQSLTETISRYIGFLEEVAAGQSRLMVIGAPLPTLPDDASNWGWVAQRRSDVQVSQRERTEVTLRFNDLVGQHCRKNGWAFVDTDSALLDPDTGLVNNRYVRDDGDHHLRKRAYRRAIARALTV